ncbi:MAG: GNAT family N-acetyltransferase [Clostridia bacterium]|nr:GNAT family N-acetyltransferase [Clostridia bacterium]
MSDRLIRPAEPEDISRIAEILVFAKRTAYRPIFEDDFFSFQVLTVLSVIEELRQDPVYRQELWVYDDGIVKGMLRRRVQGDAVELVELYVDPFFQKSGVGHALIEAFLAEARQQNFTRAFLWVLAPNLAARRFYEAHHFAHDGGSQILGDVGVEELRYAVTL